MYAKISSPSRPASQALTTRSTSSRASSLWIAFSCFSGLRVARVELELLGDDRQVGHPPLLEALVVLLGRDELDEVATAKVTTVSSDSKVGVLLVEAGRAARRRCRAPPTASLRLRGSSYFRFTVSGVPGPHRARFRVPRLRPPTGLPALVSWPVVVGLYRCAPRGSNTCPREVSCLPRTTLELRPLAARDTDCSPAAAALHGQVGALQPAVEAGPGAAGAFKVRRGEGDIEALRPRSQLAKEGEIVGMFPEGTRRPKRAAQEARRARAHRRRPDRAGRACPLVPAAINGTDRLSRLGPLRVAFGEPPIPRTSKGSTSSARR